jgi:hypothetical protein
MARSLKRQSGFCSLYRVRHLIDAVMMLLDCNTGMFGADEDSGVHGVEI